MAFHKGSALLFTLCLIHDSQLTIDTIWLLALANSAKHKTNNFA